MGLERRGLDFLKDRLHLAIYFLLLLAMTHLHSTSLSESVGVRNIQRLVDD